ncbi:MAG: hypothetical protein GX025_10670 [Clostridiales bacterium]|nr:hypothetical protein [Clostridiales bacterium]
MPIGAEGVSFNEPDGKFNAEYLSVELKCFQRERRAFRAVCSVKYALNVMSCLKFCTSLQNGLFIRAVDFDKASSGEALTGNASVGVFQKVEGYEISLIN